MKCTSDYLCDQVTFINGTETKKTETLVHHSISLYLTLTVKQDGSVSSHWLRTEWQGFNFQ